MEKKKKESHQSLRNFVNLEGHHRKKRMDHLPFSDYYLRKSLMMMVVVVMMVLVMMRMMMMVMVVMMMMIIIIPCRVLSYHYI